MKTGDLGVGIPFTPERFFFPSRPIAISLIGVALYVSKRGLAVLADEEL